MKTCIIYFNLLLILLLSACSDNDWNGQWQQSAEEPVTLLTEYPSWGTTTRAYEDIIIPEKDKFAEGDLIQVQGDFTVGNQIVRRYDAYRYDGNKWTAVNGNTRLTWPWNAEKGTFTAYYIPNMTTALSETEGSFDGELGGNPLMNDPLKAYVEDVPYGYAVNLVFKHICTRLVLLNTKNNYAEEYWFKKGGEFHNGYKLTYAPQGDGLGFSFVSHSDTNDGTISTTKVMASNAGTNANAGYVVLYLEPGKYKGSELNYSGDRLYLSLDVDVLDTPGEGEDGLQAGKSYILDIEQAKGIIDKETTDDPWDNPDQPETDFDIQELLDAISKGETYKDIIQKDNAGNLVLTKNLNFGGKEFKPVDLPTNITFDANFHYIDHAIHSIFFQCDGNVRNLEIRNTNITGFANTDAYRSGALARVSKGNIDNVRLRNLSITLPGLNGTDRTLSIGGLVGQHSDGQISNICVIGTHSITMDDTQVINGSLYMGGIVGQATGGNAKISNVSMLADENGNAPEIKITFKSNGESSSAVGGIAGATSIPLENCTFDATIDCSGATVRGCGVGGLFGREISQDNASSYTIQHCNVSGTIKGPHCQTQVTEGGTTHGRSSVGGLGGGVQGANVTITDCNSFCEVNDYFSATNMTPTASDYPNGEIYATGSAFGRITSGNSINQIKNCTAWGKVNAKTIAEGVSYIGSFVGYTRKDFSLGTNNRVNTSANPEPMQICGGVFDGAN